MINKKRFTNEMETEYEKYCRPYVIKEKMNGYKILEKIRSCEIFGLIEVSQCETIPFIAT